MQKYRSLLRARGPNTKGTLVLQIRRTTVTLDEEEMMALEQIILDRDEKEALKFLKKAVYDKIASSQRGKLKTDLDMSV